MQPFQRAALALSLIAFGAGLAYQTLQPPHVPPLPGDIGAPLPTSGALATTAAAPDMGDLFDTAVPGTGKPAAFTAAPAPPSPARTSSRDATQTGNDAGSSPGGLLKPLFDSQFAFVRTRVDEPPGDEWCRLDAAVTTTVADAGTKCHDRTAISAAAAPGKPLPRCTVRFDEMEGCRPEPSRLGNFTDAWQLRAFDRFPVIPKSQRHALSVTAAQREAYWVRSPSPFDVRCSTCEGELVHSSMLYSARRWWSTPTWMRYTAKNLGGKKLPNLLLGLTRDALIGTSFALMMDEYATAPSTWTNVSLAAIDTVAICLPASADTVEEQAFVAVRASPGGSEDTSVHVFRMALQAAGARCFWRSMQLFFGAGNAESPKIRFASEGTSVPFVKLRSTACHAADEARTVRALLGDPTKALESAPLAFDTELPYLPCHRPWVGDLQKAAVNSGNADRRYLTFWPTKCEAIYAGDVGPSDCPGRIDPASIAASPRLAPNASIAGSGRVGPGGVRVAVVLSGFIRSFSFTKYHIFTKLVEPHDADLYGATWNVVGRVRKGQPIPPKMMPPLPKMRAMIFDLLRAGAPARMTDEEIRERYRYEVYEYRKFVRFHQVVKAAGYPQGSMYQTMMQSLDLLLASGKAYDVVLRSRWDLFAAQHFRFTRLPVPDASPTDAAAATAQSPRWLLDVGAHCKMDGVWYPRTMVVEDGKLIRHTADTRFKLFGWQACDFLDVGTFETTRRFAGLLRWILRNNVYSVAQWVEHAFLVDQGLSYVPAHLYVCLQRHPNKFFC